MRIQSRPNTQSFDYVFKHYLSFQEERIGLPYPYGIKQETFDTYAYRAEHVREFFRMHNITSLSQINLHIGHRLLNWLIGECKYEVAYANKVVMMLKTVLTYAADHLRILVDTLRALRLYNPRKPKKYLRESDVMRLQAHRFSSARLEQVKDLFLIQCYTGFSYCDLMHFTQNWINVHYTGQPFISYSRQKVEESAAIVPLFPEALQIMKKYDKCLPRISNQKYNMYLREVFDQLDMPRYTTKAARKTCGYMMLNAGYSIESVSRVLGHSNIATTQRFYADVTAERILLEESKVKGIGSHAARNAVAIPPHKTATLPGCACTFDDAAAARVSSKLVSHAAYVLRMPPKPTTPSDNAESGDTYAFAPDLKTLDQRRHAIR